MASDEKSIILEARKRFSAAKAASADVRKSYQESTRMTYGDQWDPATRSAREKASRPALSFPVLHTYVQRVTNQARKERPQPKVNAVGADSSQKVAEVYEGLFRHVHVASAADVAYDTAVECAGSGGFGYFEFTTEYVDDTTFDQEPRIRRILDPLSVYFDPGAIEPDYSDANYYFKRRRIHKDDFKRDFGKEPESDWDDEAAKEEWCDGDYVYIAEYCYVEKSPRTMEQKDPATGEVIASRVVIDRTIKKCIIDGARVLEETTWLGKWLPIVPVLGKEVVVDGKRKLFSVIAFALDSQKLINATGSGVAEQLQLASRAPWVGPKGSMKDKRWDDNTQNWTKLEYEAYDGEMNPLPAPQRNAYEAPVQGLTQSLMLFTDNVKKAVGYVDTVVNPSQADLSGIAVQRRGEQSDLTNSHFEDNLVRSQWHGGRILLDLIQKYIDTPRAMRILAADGTVTMQAITMATEPGGEAPLVPGYEDKPHVRIDQGRYDVTIATGKSYNSRLQEQSDVLIQAMQSDPALWATYADVLFKSLGYPELEERAKITLPPAIQQALAAKQEGMDAKATAMLSQAAQANEVLKQQLAELQKGLQKLLFERQAKILETQGRIQIAQMDNESDERIAAMKGSADMAVQDSKHRHDGTKTMLNADLDFMKHAHELLLKSELAPDPNLVTASKLAAIKKPVNGSVQ